MSNVIPPTGQVLIKRMYRSRFIITGSLVLIASACMALLALSPSYVALHVNASPSSSAAAQRITESDRTDLAKAEALLSAVGPLLSSTTSPTHVVSEMLSLKVPGLRIDHINYTSGDIAVMTISGSADAPARIDAYRKALASQTLFSNVSVPVGDLVGAPGGRFSMTLQLHH